MRIRQIVYAILSILWSVTGSSICHAAIACENADDSIRHYQIDETVVVGQKISDKVTSATPSYQINSDQILRKGISDISDAIHRLPGALLKDYGGAGGLKTVSVRGLGAAHTSVSYDGMPVTDVQNGAIDFSRYSIENISSLELVSGDNTDVFITASMAAAPASISLTTPIVTGDKSADLTALLKVGSFGLISPYLRAGKKFGNVTIGITGEYAYSRNNYPFKLKNGNVTTIERRDNSTVKSGNAELNLLWQLPSKASLAAKLYYYDNSRDLPGPVIYYNVNSNKEHLHDRDFFGQASWQMPIGDKWKFKGGIKFNRTTTFYNDYGSQQQGKYIEENYWQREYYATATLLFQTSSIWQLSYSADYSLNNLNSNLISDTRPQRQAIIQALSAKLSLSRLQVLARLVESIYISHSDGDIPPDRNRLSPSIAVTAKLLRSGLLYGRISYKNIFRMPTFNEAYFRHFGAVDLKPETTDQLNLGLTYQMPTFPILPLLEVTADVYKNWVKDKIVAVPYNLFIWTITNLESVHVTGADITINSTISFNNKHQLLLTGTWGWQRAMINVDSDNRLYRKQVAYTPLNSGSFSLSYENPWVNIVASGQGCSARYADNTNLPQTRLPGYFEFGLSLWRRLNFRFGSFEIKLSALNILDKQYSVIARYPMPGRSFLASLKFNL